MIHSLLGGTIQNITYHNFAKVLLDNGEIKYYIFTFSLAEKDKVLVPYGRTTQTGVVQKILKNVSSRESPIPLKHAQQIIKKCD